MLDVVHLAVGSIGALGLEYLNPRHDPAGRLVSRECVLASLSEY
jgi:hypothetical protein